MVYVTGVRCNTVLCITGIELLEGCRVPAALQLESASEPQQSLTVAGPGSLPLPAASLEDCSAAVSLGSTLLYAAPTINIMQRGSAGAAWYQMMYEGHVKGPPLAATSHLSSVPAFMSSWAGEQAIVPAGGPRVLCCWQHDSSLRKGLLSGMCTMRRGLSST